MIKSYKDSYFSYISQLNPDLMFALFVEQNLATGAREAVFDGEYTKTKKSQISLRLDLERKTRV